MIFFRRSANKKSKPATGPQGMRAFAIGDIHGRLDLAEALLNRIQQFRAQAPGHKDYLILLGDLIDRGADSRGVIEWAMARLPADMQQVFLTGNHEEMMLRVLGTESDLIWDWLSYGGYEFAQSYGVDAARLSTLGSADAAAYIRSAIPPSHLAFVADFADSFRFGDYLFVHAGIRPGSPIEEQDTRDLRWIRGDFLSSNADHGCIVVHGHTITEAPEERVNRIGIDTGAYMTGMLTALVVDGEQREFLVATDGDLARR